MKEHNPSELIPLPIPVPPDLAEAFGYPGDSRFVGVSWQPAGDEVVYHDGRSFGTGDPWAFLVYIRHRVVAPHLEPYNLGSSDCEATHCLIIDRQEHRAAIAVVAVLLLADWLILLTAGKPYAEAVAGPGGA